MNAYRKFSDGQQSELCTLATPNPPKAPKSDQPRPKILVDLGALAGGTPGYAAFSVAAAELKRAAATWRKGEEERAAIGEYEGDIPHAWAGGYARLDPDRPPGDVPPARWRRFVDDMGPFLDRWAAYAAALGWTPYDLFGCDRDRPFAPVDKAGLLWLVNGDRLVMLADDAATVERRNGLHQTYRRKPGEAGRVLAWELP